MGLITMEHGAEGQALHGSSGPDFNPHEYYVFRNGQLHNGLIAVMWQLADVPAGAGGFCIVNGTHKANLPLPEDMRLGLTHSEHVRQLEMKAGDVVIFSVRRLLKNKMPQRTESRCRTGRRPQRTAPSPGRRSTRGAL